MTFRAALLLPALWFAACAARGHVATPDEMALLLESRGLSASGRLTLAGPGGRFSTPLVFGAARPDFLRIEIPAGSGLRFLLVTGNGELRADFPEDDATFRGNGTKEVMSELFGIELSPADLVAAILGSPPPPLSVRFRFEERLPVQLLIRDARGARLTLTLDEREMSAPRPEAFAFGPPRGRSWTLKEMSSRLGLRR